MHKLDFCLSGDNKGWWWMEFIVQSNSGHLVIKRGGGGWVHSNSGHLVTIRGGGGWSLLYTLIVGIWRQEGPRTVPLHQVVSTVH